MSTSSLSIFEEVIGRPVKVLFTGSEAHQEQARSALYDLDLSPALEALIEFEASNALPVYPAQELVPRLYDAEKNYGGGREFIGPPPPRFGAGIKDIWAALLYCHRIEFDDPLIGAVRYKVAKREFANFVLLQTLYKLHMLRPLIDQKIIRLTRQPANEVDFDALINQAYEDRFFCETVLSIVPRVAGSRDWYDAPDWRSPDLGERKDESPRWTASRVDEFRAILDDERADGEWYDMERDLRRFFRAWADSNADLWFPSTAHLAIGSALCSAPGNGFPTSQVERLPIRIAKLLVANFDDISVNDLIAIRLSSDAFQGWREAVQQSFQALDKSTSLRIDRHTANAHAAEVLAENAKTLIEKLRRDSHSMWSGALRGFVVGVAGSAPASVAGGIDSVGLGALGGVSGLVAGLAWDRIASSSQRRAMRSIPRHVAALGAAFKS
jgi:hypothetical protein